MLKSHTKQIWAFHLESLLIDTFELENKDGWYSGFHLQLKFLFS